MSLLAQLQLADSAFPSGLYTLSHGLEAYTQAGPVDVAALLEDVLLHAVGPGDATALVLAHRAVLAGDWDTVAAVDRRLHAVKLSREQRAAATRTGNQVLRTATVVFGLPELTRLAELVGAGAAPGNHAVVLGTAHAGLGVPEDDAVTGDLYAFAASWVSAAVRLRRLDFRQAQATLYGAAGAIGRAAATALAARDPLDLCTATPLADTMSCAHERAQARLFTT
ncbi:urease accessory UreF family protein [Nonomuraea fuscirosea]|uniref:urease accessory protein UreF n=1 Tax=Nonomuraea fuscirosea TaxID=1291556 RepID=UPI003425F8D6